MFKQILIKPVLTEKITKLQEKLNQYAFDVNLRSNKIEIYNAIEKKFNVKVKNIRTFIIGGKSKSQFTRRGKFSGFTAKKKRAIVTLEKDYKIDLFENV